jgi:hypothetical protein
MEVYICAHGGYCPLMMAQNEGSHTLMPETSECWSGGNLDFNLHNQPSIIQFLGVSQIPLVEIWLGFIVD